MQAALTGDTVAFDARGRELAWLGQSGHAVVTVDRLAHRSAAGANVGPGNPAALFTDVPDELKVWASHGDFVATAPAGFVVVATSANAPISAMADTERALYAILFHPEVVHTDHGLEIQRRPPIRMS